MHLFLPHRQLLWCDMTPLNCVKAQMCLKITLRIMLIFDTLFNGNLSSAEQPTVWVSMDWESVLRFMLWTVSYSYTSQNYTVCLIEHHLVEAGGVKVNHDRGWNVSFKMKFWLVGLAGLSFIEQFIAKMSKTSIHYGRFVFLVNK